MIWLAPAALAALALVAGPILVHLLRSRRAPRRDFPTLRFIRPSTASSVRLRLPSDLLVLLVRCSVVAAAVLALARPLLLTDARVAGWNARTARAVVVDTSASMSETGDGNRAASEASASAAGELNGVFASRRFETPDLAAGLSRAVAWLETVPPARREIVLVSDFHDGAMDPKARAAVPGSIGVRFVPVGALPAERRIDDLVLLGNEAAPARRAQGTLSADGTQARFQVAQDVGRDGLRIVASPEARNDVESLLRAVAIAGAPAPAASEPLTIRFQRDAIRAEAAAQLAPWMLRTVSRLSADPAVQRHGGAVDAQPPPADVPHRTIVLRDRQGRALVGASTNGSELVLDVAAEPGSYFGAQLVQAALVARHGSFARAEAEVRPVAPRELAAWTRPAGDAPPESWGRAESTDARWFWGAALLLLALESWLRRRGPDADAAETHDAAA
jgi:hypothetical protein